MWHTVKSSKRMPVAGFTKSETIGVGLILLLIIVLSVYNFRFSQMKARDAQRKADIGSIANALRTFFDDFDFYPKEKEKRILYCGSKEALSPCIWGVDKLVDLADPTYPPYLDVIPADPKSKDSYFYVYFSNTREYQILAYLEDESDIEINSTIQARGIACGKVICNYGIASGRTPLDRDLPATPSGQLKQ